MMPQSMTKADNMLGVVYDSMGGKPTLQGHEDTFRNLVRVASDVKIQWNYGVTDTQKDSWTTSPCMAWLPTSKPYLPTGLLNWRPSWRQPRRTEAGRGALGPGISCP